MNAEERREARRKRILENSESRLKKITTLTINEDVSNGSEKEVFIKDIHENGTLNHEPDWPIPKRQTENVITPILECQQIYNYEPNHLDSKLHSTKLNYEIKFSYITIIHIILSQIVLVLFYYDLGFLFGNSIIVPFVISVIPELYMSEEQHDSIHVIVLLMLGFSQNSAKKMSRCVKLVIVTGKRFCIYVFCFTCSYVILLNLYFDDKHNSSIT